MDGSSPETESIPVSPTESSNSFLAQWRVPSEIASSVMLGFISGMSFGGGRNEEALVWGAAAALTAIGAIGESRRQK